MRPLLWTSLVFLKRRDFEKNLKISKKNIFSDHMKFIFESNEESINFLKVNINLSNKHLMTNTYIKPSTLSICIIHHFILIISSIL